MESTGGSLRRDTLGCIMFGRSLLVLLAVLGTATHVSLAFDAADCCCYPTFCGCEAPVIECCEPTWLALPSPPNATAAPAPVDAIPQRTEKPTPIHGEAPPAAPPTSPVPAVDLPAGPYTPGAHPPKFTAPAERAAQPTVEHAAPPAAAVEPAAAPQAETTPPVESAQPAATTPAPEAAAPSEPTQTPEPTPTPAPEPAQPQESAPQPAAEPAQPSQPAPEPAAEKPQEQPAPAEKPTTPEQPPAKSPDVEDIFGPSTSLDAPRNDGAWSNVEMRTWRSVEGEELASARLADVTADGVVLANESGINRVPYTQLSTDDLTFLRREIKVRRAALESGANGQRLAQGTSR